MKRLLLLWLLAGPCLAQGRYDMRETALAFLTSLSAGQRQQATFAFDDAERFNWYFVPRARKGLSLKQLTISQRQAALALLRTGLSEQGYEKATAIMDLENVLRVLENRSNTDTYRDPDNYYITIFGNPAESAANPDNPWGWRVEGHHLSVRIVAVAGPLGHGQVLGQTPTFFGSNPGHLQYSTQTKDTRMADPRVEKLPQLGRQVLKQETERAFALLKTLDAGQRKQAVLNPIAYGDIVTGNRRTVALERMDGLAFADMTSTQRALFLDLLRVYLANYRVTLANQQMARLEKAGLDKLHFAWAGDLTTDIGAGGGWYYRIHGPTLLIEYDNTQNNANHIHTVVRDLTNDFGEDLLREHYRTSRHEKP